jgi:CheY-like chemotaxis protein
MNQENTASHSGDTVILSDEPIAKDESDALAMLRSRHSGARLLVVEDNPVVRGSIQELVMAAGLKADIAENGRQAVEKAVLVRYDLILMDVLMPLMNGLEATRAIRLQTFGAEVPILAMTANAFADARPACREAGMQDFVAKPVTPFDFYTTLLKWLSAAEVQVAEPVHTLSLHDTNLPLLARIPDLELDCGLATMRGDVAKYAAALNLFADQCRQYTWKLSEMLAGAQFSAIEMLVGSLHGNARMLGALKVSEAAGEVVSACRLKAGADANTALCTILLDILTHFAETIRGTLPLPAAIANPAIDPAQLADVLTQLEAHLERGNVKANDLVREKFGLLQAAFGPSAKALQNRIEAYDFETAIAELRQLQGRLNGGAG